MIRLEGHFQLLCRTALKSVLTLLLVLTFDFPLIASAAPLPSIGDALQSSGKVAPVPRPEPVALEAN
jgi:hypothetical protein